MPNPYHDASPARVRELIEAGEIRESTAGMAAGYVQCNLIVLEKDYADEFREFARLNPQPCPVLEEFSGEPISRFLAPGANVLRSIPWYNVYRDGQLAETIPDASAYWKEGMVGFLIGCSYSFEEALLREGIEIRHITQGTPVPMWNTTIPCKPYGRLKGGTVVSMRPMTPEDAQKAREITEKMPRVHGGPVHIGDPAAIGIRDITKPDYGQPVTIREGEVPVFWACGVTPQLIVQSVHPPFALSHRPGYMFVSDILNTEIEEKLEEREKT